MTKKLTSIITGKKEKASKALRGLICMLVVSTA